MSSELDPDACIEYFTFQNIFTDRTLFRHIRQSLQSGNVLRFDLLRTEPFASGATGISIFLSDIHEHHEEEAAEELDRLFRPGRSTRQLVSDVEIGAYLSGGMDLGRDCRGRRGERPELKTFTVGFDLSSASGMEVCSLSTERAAAEPCRIASRRSTTRWCSKPATWSAACPSYAWHLEEPRVGQSYPNYYAAKLSSRFVKVVLSGTGGDELFGGYPWRYYARQWAPDFDDYVDQYYRYWQRTVPDLLVKQTSFTPIRPIVGPGYPRNLSRCLQWITPIGSRQRR